LRQLVQVRNQPVVSSNVTTYIGIVRVANKGMLLKPGMTANVKIIVRAVDNVLTVPNAALSTKLASTLGFSSATSRKRQAERAGRAILSRPGRDAAQPGPAGTGRRTDPSSSCRRSAPWIASGGDRRHGPGRRAYGHCGRHGVRFGRGHQDVYVLLNGKPVPREVEIGWPMAATPRSSAVSRKVSWLSPVLAGQVFERARPRSVTACR